MTQQRLLHTINLTLRSNDGSDVTITGDATVRYTKRRSRPLEENNNRIKEMEAELKSLRDELADAGCRRIKNRSLSENSNATVQLEEYKKVQTALKEQQEANAQLRGYMDGILTNVIVKYPELLEVKN